MNGLDRYVGQTLDEKYRLERLLGRGGMGAVYLATHLGTERYVALKLIAPQFMGNDEFVERFKREARAAGRLRHPNIVDVTDFGFARAGGESIAYLVMEYLDGCTLTDVLAEEKRLPLDWVVDILEQVCNAVHEAHKQGIVHRDLKPDNIWLEPNRLGGYRAKVLDFGIAKVAESNNAPPVSPVKQSRNQTPTIRVMPPPDAVSPGVSQPAAAPPMPGPAAKNESKPAVEATIKIDWGAPLPRSRALVSRSRRTIVIAMLFQFLAPILTEKLIATLTGINTAAKGSMHLKVVSELASLSSIFLLPLLAIVPALLYLKMRQLGGETLTDVMAQLEAGGARTKWEHRMRERISMTPRKPTT